MIWPFAPPDWSVWRHGQAPPQYFSQKAQMTARLSAPLFSIDSLLQSSLSNHGEFCKGLSGCVYGISLNCPAPERNRKFLHFDGKWPRCRGPPPWKSESYPSALIFRFSEVALCTTENIFGFFSETFLTRSKTARVILYHYSRA